MRVLAILLLVVGVVSSAAQAKVTVTPETFARADVDVTFANVVSEVGSNKFRHDRSLSSTSSRR